MYRRRFLYRQTIHSGPEMKKNVILMLYAVALPAFAQNVAPPISAEQIAQYKKQGAGIANSVQSLTPQISQSGEMSYDTNGKPVMARPGVTTAEDKGRYFSSMSGVTGIQSTGAVDRGVVGASVASSAFADFSCKLQPGAVNSVSGRMLKYGGCNSGSTISTITLSICSATVKGGTCGPDDYTPAKAYAANAYDTLGGMRVGIGCNDSNKSCRVTLDETYAVSGTPEQLSTAAKKQIAEGGTNTAQADIANRYLSDSRAQLQAKAAAISSCTEAQRQAAAESGVVATCGTEDKPIVTAAVGDQADTSNCTDTPMCTRQASRTITYSQSCTRTFPLTGYSCNFNIPKLECMVTKETATGKLTNSCSTEDLDGATKVRSDESMATCATKDAAGICLTQSWTDYYTQPKKASLDGDCASTPFPLSGTPSESCLNKGKGGTTTCREDGWWQRTLTNDECTVTTLTDAGGGRTTQSVTQLTEQEKAGCGVCLKTTSNDTCYARPTEAEPQDSCANIDFNACRLVSSTPQSQYEGMTLSQQDVYSCEKQETSCAEYDRSNMCSSVSKGITFGLDKDAPSQSTSPEEMNKALADAALIDAISTGTVPGGEGYVPQIFGGDDSRCEKPVGFLNGVTDNDCCRMDLDRPGGGKVGNKCSEDEVKLAVSRRANFTVFVGEYCSNESGWGPFKRCTERTQTYCDFKGLLPRIIQQQGRVQLATLATSGGTGSVQKRKMQFAFYEGKGGWGAPTAVNGVTIVPWQYPAYCADPEKAAKALETDPNALACPTSLIQQVAICEKAEGCGEMPATPNSGSGKWLLPTVDPLKNMTTAVSRYAMMTGACDPASGNCSYEVAAWPAGVGGEAVASKAMTFPLFAAPDAEAASKTSNLNAMGDYVFRPVPQQGVMAPGTPLPATVRVDFSRDAGRSFVSVDLPSTIVGTDFGLPNGGDVRIAGGCNAATNTCTYTATGTVTVTAKPWGSAKQPDCTGFTPGQLSVLDFSKMDLSEWVASITATVAGKTSSDLGTLAEGRVREMQTAQAAGNSPYVASSNPQSLQSATITPNRDVGPFVASLRVAGNYPVYYDDVAKNVDPVSRVDVDWGDCTVPQTVPVITGATGGAQPAYGYGGQHRYVSPEAVPLTCGGGRHTINHPVKVTIYSKSGTHQATLNVENVWNNYGK
jgi:hypothetical protein